MLEWLLEQKRAIALYCHDIEITNLAANQWNVIEKVVKTLRPFKEETKKASSLSASAGMIIPSVRILKRFLEKHARQGDDVGIQTMRFEMLKSLRK